MPLRSDTSSAVVAQCLKRHLRHCELHVINSLFRWAAWKYFLSFEPEIQMCKREKALKINRLYFFLVG